MTLPENTNRRTVLKTLGTAVVGGTVLTETAAAGGNVVSKINSSGHYSYFPLGPEYWGRQKHPYDYREGESRWLAEPASGGAVRCRVKNIEIDAIPNRNAGFDIHLEPLSDLETVTIASETVESRRGSATLLGGIYLDVNSDGEFGAWEKEKGNRDRFAGLDGDEEALFTFDAGGTFTIQDDTTMTLLAGEELVEWGDLRNGDVEGIDDQTQAALYVGIADRGQGSPEEAIIREVNIQRS